MQDQTTMCYVSKYFFTISWFSELTFNPWRADRNEIMQRKDMEFHPNLQETTGHIQKSSLKSVVRLAMEQYHLWR